MRRLRPVLSCLLALLLTLAWSVVVAHCLRLRTSPAGTAAVHHSRDAPAAHDIAGHGHAGHGDAAYGGAAPAGRSHHQPPPDDEAPEDDAPVHRAGGSFCPACQILSASGLPVPPEVKPRIVPIEMAAAPHPAGALPARPRAPPQQPRAPPPTALA